MRKFFSLLMMLAFVVGSVFAENTRIYCKMAQSWWTDGAASVGAYAWTDGQPSNAEWPGVKMAAVEGQNGLWAIDLDLSKFEKVVFTRLNPAGTEYWGAKTEDLTIPTDGKNLFLITSTTAQWDDQGKKVAGEWSEYSANEPFVGFDARNGDLGTQIAGGLAKNLLNTKFSEVSEGKYEIIAVNGGVESSFLFGGVEFAYKNSGANKTAWKTFGTYISSNGKDREIRIPAKKGQAINVVLSEDAANVLVDGESQNLVKGDNILTAAANGLVLKTTDDSKPKIQAILPGEEPEPPVEAKFYITGESLVGSWAPDALPSYDKTYVFESLAAGEYVFKITVDGTWNTAKGFTNLTTVAPGVLQAETDDNIYFKLDEAGSVSITFDGESFFLEGKFHVDEPAAEAKFFITGESLVGSWAPDALPSYEVSYVFEDLAAGEYVFKITVDGTWNTAKGFTNLTTVAPGVLQAETDDNIYFKLDEAGKVTVHYDGEFFFLTGNFHVDPAPAAKYFLKNNWEGTEWTWKELIKDEEEAEPTYVLSNVIFGGTGVNISSDPENDPDPKFIEAKDIEAFDLNYDPAVLEAGDKVIFIFKPENVSSFTGANGLSAIIIEKGGVVPPVEHKFFITGESLVGSWAPDALPVDADSYTFENLLAGVAYSFKVTVDGTWETSKGFADLTVTPAGVSGDADGNVCFKLAEDGNVVITYTAEVFTVEGNFEGGDVPPVDEPKFYIAGEGEGLSWDAEGWIASYEVSRKLDLAAGDYKLKVIVGDAWKGFSDLTWPVDGLSADADGNICFKLDEAGEVTVHYEAEAFFLNGNFHVDPAPAARYFLKNNWEGTEWTWKELIKDEEEAEPTYVLSNVIFGGTGVNISSDPENDPDPKFIEAKDIEAFDLNYDPAVLEAGDKVIFIFKPENVSSFTGANGLSAIIIEKGGVVPPVEHKFFITGESLVGSWAPDALPVDADSYTFENLLAGVAYSFKVTVDGTWETSKGFADLTVTPAGVSGDADGNVCFKLAEDGNVVITYTAEAFTVEGNFEGGDVPPVDEPKFYIAGEGEGLSWDAEGWIASYEVSRKLDLAAGDYKLKVVVGDAWKGFSDLTWPVDGLSADADGNICFKLDEAGEVTVHYEAEAFFLNGNFHVDPAPAARYFLKNNWEGTEWTWKELIKDEEEAEPTYVLSNVIFGGTGVNISSDPENDPDPKFIEAKDIEAFDLNYDPAVLEAGDKVIFIFKPENVSSFTGANGLSAIIIEKGGVVPPVEHKFFITGESLVGSWAPDALPVDADSYTFENLLAGVAYSFKVTVDGTWETTKGFEDLTVTPAGVSGDADGNVCFKLAEDGNVVITYTAEVFTVEGNFEGGDVPPVDEPKFYIAGEGEGLSWDAEGWIASYEVSRKLDLAAGDYKLKVVVGDAWKGFSDLTWPVDGLSADADGNICFKLDEAGEVTVHYEAEAFFLNGNFHVDPAPAAKYFLKNNWDGATDWTWKELIKDEEEAEPTYVLSNVIFGGTGVNISSDPENDPDPKFIEAKDIEAFDLNYDPAVLEAGDKVIFIFKPENVSSFTGANGLSAIIIEKGGVVPPVEHKFFITGESLVGSWAPDALPVDADSYTFENLLAGVAYSFKVTVDGTWETSKGFADLTVTPAGVSGDADGNVCFKLAEDGNVVITYTAEAFTVEGNFEVEEPIADGFYLIGTFNKWAISAQYKFELNPGAEEGVVEYMVNVTLQEGDELKGVIVSGGVPVYYYPEGGNIEVTADYAGEKTIYFRPYGNSDWEWTYIYIEKNGAQGIEDALMHGQAVKVLRDGQIFILKGNRTYTPMGQLVK